MQAEEYVWVQLECPRCGQQSQLPHKAGQPVAAMVVNCGDCLMNEVEIVQLKAIGLAEQKTQAESPE